jgi:hypothetical protein
MMKRSTFLLNREALHIFKSKEKKYFEMKSSSIHDLSCCSKAAGQQSCMIQEGGFNYNVHTVFAMATAAPLLSSPSKLLCSCLSATKKLIKIFFYN